MENLVDFYLSKLKNRQNNAGEWLNKFYCSLFNAEWSVSTLQQFHRLVRTYGRYRVFFALITIHDSYLGKGRMIELENPYPLLSHIIRDSLKREYAGEIEKNRRSLEGYIKAYKDNLEKEKVTVPESFEEKDDS